MVLLLQNNSLIAAKNEIVALNKKKGRYDTSPFLFI